MENYEAMSACLGKVALSNAGQVAVRRDWIKNDRVTACVVVRRQELIRRIMDGPDDVEAEWFSPTLADVLGEKVWAVVEAKNVPEPLLR